MVANNPASGSLADNLFRSPMLTPDRAAAIFPVYSAIGVKNVNRIANFQVWLCHFPRPFRVRGLTGLPLGRFGLFVYQMALPCLVVLLRFGNFLLHLFQIGAGGLY